MKTLMIALSIFATNMAFACGNFAGSFTCTVQGDNYTYALEIEQSGNIFKITDDEGTDEFIADGVKRPLPNDTNLRNAYYIGTCKRNFVRLNMTGEIFDDETGQSFPFSSNMEHAMKTRNHVTQTTVTEVLGQSTTSITQCRRD